MDDLGSGNVPCVLVFGTTGGRVVCAGVDKGKVILV